MVDISNAVPSFAADKPEGPIAKTIEQRTAKLPSDLFLWAAGASIAGSLAFQWIRMGRARRLAQTFGVGMPTRSGQLSLFIGQWAPVFLLLGIYNKIVKVAGSDAITP